MQKRSDTVVIKDFLIGVLLVLAVFSVFYAVRNNVTGKAVDTLNTGILDVKPYVKDTAVDVYINGKYTYTVPADKKPYYTLKAGSYRIKVVAQGCKDYTDTVEIKAGETTDFYVPCRVS